MKAEQTLMDVLTAADRAGRKLIELRDELAEAKARVKEQEAVVMRLLREEDRNQIEWQGVRICIDQAEPKLKITGEHKSPARV